MPSAIPAFSSNSQPVESRANATTKTPPDYFSLAYKAILTLGACTAFWVSPQNAIAGTAVGFAFGYIKDKNSDPEVENVEENRGLMTYRALVTSAFSYFVATTENPNWRDGGSVALGFIAAQRLFYPLVRDRINEQK